MTEEGINDINKYLNSKEAYITPGGELIYGSGTDTIEYALKHMTKDNPKNLSNEDMDNSTISNEYRILTFEELKNKNTKEIKIPSKYKKIYNDSNYKDYYYAVKTGEVYKITQKENKLNIKLMQPFTTRDGYLEYVLTTNEGKKKHIQGQLIIAKTFLGKPKSKEPMQVNHKDGNRKNNNVSNLEWVTRSENIKHSFSELGKVVHNKGKKKQSDGSYK